MAPAEMAMTLRTDRLTFNASGEGGCLQFWAGGQNVLVTEPRDAFEALRLRLNEALAPPPNDAEFR